MIENDKAIVQHVERHTSDHCLLLLDTKPTEKKRKKRFCFDKIWLSKLEIEEVIRKAWEWDCIGSPMFQVACKIKRCRMVFLTGPTKANITQQ